MQTISEDAGHSRSLRGRAAVVGVGETTYYKHGKSPDSEFKLALKAILAACADAGISPKDIDGFASYSNDRSEAVRLATALGIRELRYANMVWGGGGAGVAAAVGNAAAAVATGMADVVVVHRSLAQGQFKRFGRAAMVPGVSGDAAYETPYGVISQGQKAALKVTRFMHDHGIGQEALRAISMTAYAHAQRNPRAVMNGRPLTEDAYDASRWIAEPLHLFDCCMENDGAAAMVVVSADRARDFPHKPAYLLGVASGQGFRAGAAAYNAPDWARGGFEPVARRLYAMARLSPKDVQVLQTYDHFTGGVLFSLVEHGFFKPEDANAFLQLPNLQAPDGRLPLNTSGGNLAECYMHGLGLQIEAVRQIRGTSTAQARRSDVSMAIAGSMAMPVSSLIYGSEMALR